LNNTSEYVAGIIGSGSFGTAMANLMAENGPVLLYTRRPEVVEKIRSGRKHKGQNMHPQVKLTTELPQLAERCHLIFPIVPSAAFGSLLHDLAPLLHPYHILIHGTKGLEVKLEEGESLAEVESLRREQVKTMSELIMEETVVKRVGCIAGPNLAFEIAAGQPAATVIGSHFEEVIREGSAAMRSSRFRVHASHDLLGIELAGVLKNIMAICSGMLHGLGYGDNTLALLLTRGMAEMIRIGKGLGADPRAFLGLAGIGDLIATCSSPHSRNYTVGFRLAKGEALAEVLEDMEEVAEGVKTSQIARALASHYKIPAPITQAIYRILAGDLAIDRAVRLLMEYPFTEDVEFI
jgi:glycerol-3-phosphate dehydrogenase (NAD(P)+)